MALGEVAYVDAPLYDYTQHGSAVIGHSVANRKPRAVRKHLLERLRNPGDGSRVAYYYAWHQQLLQARVLRIRCWDRMTASKRATLERLIDADRRRHRPRLAAGSPRSGGSGAATRRSTASSSMGTRWGAAAPSRS